MVQYRKWQFMHYMCMSFCKSNKRRLGVFAASELTMSGSLGGFHVFDITPEVKRHQRLFCVGQDISQTNIPYHTFTSRDMYKTCNESAIFDDTNSDAKAFTFEFSKPLKRNASRSGSPCLDSTADTDAADCIKVSLKVASLCYTHSPATLHQLSQCVSEFKEYRSSVAKSLKNVASEVAKGMVAKRGDLSQTGLFGSNTSLDKYSKYRSNISLDRTEMEYLENATFCEETEKKSPKIILDASFDSPAIVVPKSSTSSQVLVAHLGQISLSNCDDKGQVNYTEEVLSEQTDKKTDRIFLEVRKMNLYSVDIDKNAQANRSAINLDESFRYSPLNINTDVDLPIMFDTTVQVTIDHSAGGASIINANQDDFLSKDVEDCIIMQETQSLLDMKAKIQTPVKLVLQKNVYEQILQTSDYLSSVEAKFEQSPSSSNVNQNISDDSVPMATEESLNGHSPSGVSSRDSNDVSSSSTVLSSVPVPFLCKKLKLEVPVFIVELQGHFDEGQKGLVDLKLHDFLLDLVKDNPATTKVDLSLRSIVMEDLLQDPNSSYRKIVVSKDPEKDDAAQMKPHQFMSHSCPDNAIVAPVPMMPSSLPSSFHEHLSKLNKPIVSRPLVNPFVTGYTKGKGKPQKQE